MKISELEGARKLLRIECACGEVWTRTRDKNKDNRERRYFIAKHADHEIHGLTGTSTVTQVKK